jgi:hypothetical protein
MAKEVYYRAWCDYPGCRDDHVHLINGQETQPVEVWVYTPGKGRKPNPIKVEMCEEHLAEMKALYAHLSKFNQRGEEVS